MAVNPVFNRIDKEAAQGGYAGFGSQPSSYPPPQGPPTLPAQGGYPGPSETLSNEQLQDMYSQAPAGPALKASGRTRQCLRSFEAAWPTEAFRCRSSGSPKERGA